MDMQIWSEAERFFELRGGISNELMNFVNKIEPYNHDGAENFDRVMDRIMELIEQDFIGKSKEQEEEQHDA